MTFDVAAEAYDQYMGRWSQDLSARFAALAGVQHRHRVLDIGCGPGALTAELVRSVGAASVAAIDPSAPFVEAVRARHPGVDVRQATAERIPFDADTFDATLAQLVVHFMNDPVAGLAEMARVTRPGGVVAACVWDYAGDRGPLGPFWVAARELDPTVAGEAHLAGTRDGHLAELLEAAGLREVRPMALSATRDFEGFDSWWEPFTRGVGPGGAYLARLHARDREALRQRCRSKLPGGAFTLTAWAWTARGVV
ncbi:MAG: class I SAM-dependent methyltransferase [Chloroflexota bacterium]